MSLFDEIISQSLIIILGSPFIFWIYSKDIKWFYVGMFVYIPLQFHSLIKIFSKNYNYDFLKRPIGAANCDLLSRNGNQEGKPGFPSGHMTSTVSFITSVYLLFPEYRSLCINFGLIYTLLMAMSRMNKRCHTLIQVIAGSILGFLSPIVLKNLFIK
jgi:membrane-associated phospholipid phosphatase